ncbi:hypothetical protein [Casimicrobium huifangae]|uniref:hypothetical protein n=1 Tax=Casimicrobium huifangae TaxID=2591109 RepID=UPI0037843FF9
MSAEPRVLICGSMAFDTICVFPGRFAEHIVPGATHKISVSFLVENMRREFGGCAGNIAYTLKLLGGAPVICAAIGDDGAERTRSACRFWWRTCGASLVAARGTLPTR